MTVPHPGSSVVFNNLDPEGSYGVSVGAVNGQGAGNVSEPVSVPPAIVPSTGMCCYKLPYKEDVCVSYYSTCK